MALNMYSFFLPLNIVKYQPSFIEIMLTVVLGCRGEISGLGRDVSDSKGNPLLAQYNIYWHRVVYEKRRLCKFAV